MKHLYFIRHGLSEMNVQGLFSGSSETHLTKLGVEQAETAGAKARLEGLKFDIILSSPLQRACDTAQIVAKHVDYPIEKIVLNGQLRERHFGDMEGKKLEDFDRTPTIYISDPYSIDHIPNVEKIMDLQSRADVFLQYLQSLPQDTVLVVSHGAFGRALRRAVNNHPLTEFGEFFENAEVIKLI